MKINQRRMVDKPIWRDGGPDMDHECDKSWVINNLEACVEMLKQATGEKCHKLTICSVSDTCDMRYECGGARPHMERDHDDCPMQRHIGAKCVPVIICRDDS